MKRLLELHWEILAPKSVLNSVFDALLEKRRKDFKLHYHHNRKRYFRNHVQSTLGGGLQYLSLKSIFSTPNKQRKRSNPNGSLLLNFQLNFSKMTSTDVLLILLIFDFRRRKMRGWTTSDVKKIKNLIKAFRSETFVSYLEIITKAPEEGL